MIGEANGTVVRCWLLPNPLRDSSLVTHILVLPIDEKGSRSEERTFSYHFHICMSHVLAAARAWTQFGTTSKSSQRT